MGTILHPESVKCLVHLESCKYIPATFRALTLLFWRNRSVFSNRRKMEYDRTNKAYMVLSAPLIPPTHGAKMVVRWNVSLKKTKMVFLSLAQVLVGL